RDLTLFPFHFLPSDLIYVFMLILIFAPYHGTYCRATKYQMRMKKNATAKFRTQSELCSIVIPARNEESVIKRTVLNCLQQTYQNIEVIVVAHNCSDRTFEEAKVEDPRVKVFRLDTKEAGKGIALHYAVSN